VAAHVTWKETVAGTSLGPRNSKLSTTGTFVMERVASIPW
jgi:hypothetical protein